MESPSKPEVGIVKQSRLKRLFKPSKKNLLLTIPLLLAVLIIGLIISLVLQPSRIPAPAKVDISDVSDYSDMSYEQKNYYLYSKTGLTIEHLKSQETLGAKSFKNFDAANQASQLFTALGDYERAKQAYAAAEAKGAPADDYQFHLDYAYVALLAKDKATWKQQMLIARDIAAKRPEPKDSQEASIADVIDSRIKTTEAFYE